MQFWLLFTVGAALSWGCYGVALHKGQMAFTDAEKITKSLRALLCVGGAYFLVGVVVPVIVLLNKGQLTGFTVQGTIFSTACGILGAAGAVCIIWAFKNGGSPLYVMPLVFAGAPVINAIISTLEHPPKDGINPMLYAGFALLAGGAFLVLRYKPA